MSEITQTGANEWAKGWPIVLSALVGIALCLSPLPYWALIVIGNSLTAEFGWTREQWTSGLLFMTAGVLSGAPIVGLLTDKYGARRVLLPSIIFLGIGVALFSRMTANISVFYTIFYFTAVLGSGTLPITWSKSIVNNFDRYRGLALGIALTGTGLYGFLAPGFIGTIIKSADWRTAYLAVGLLPILFSFPLAFIFFKDKKEEQALAKAKTEDKSFLRTLIFQILIVFVLYGLMITLTLSKGPIWVAFMMLTFLAVMMAFSYFQTRADPDTASLPGLTLKESFRDYRFWILIISFLILGAAVSGVIVNTVNILMDKGYALETATSRFAGVGLIGLSVLVGRLVGGFLVDYIWAPLIGFVFMGVPAIGCYILMQDASVAMNAFSIILVGFAAGVEFDLMAYYVSRYLGMRSYGRIYSFLYVAFGVGSGTSPAIFNTIRGDAANYNLSLTVTLFGFLIGATLLLFLGKYRDFEIENSNL